MSFSNAISEVALTYIDWHPPFLCIKLRENVIAGLVVVEANRQLVNEVAVAFAARPDPIAGL